jgi:hypothetical protein
MQRLHRSSCLIVAAVALGLLILTWNVTATTEPAGRFVFVHDAAELVVALGRAQAGDTLRISPVPI